jgi:large subunit ribosomal protein L24
MARMTTLGKIKLRKNDTVKVIAGREKGKTGRVVSIDRDKGRAVIEGLNMVKKAVKQKKQNQKAGITSVEAPLSVGKIMIMCKKCGPTRIGYVIDDNGKKRVCRKCGGDL